jgi:hypothetical protein
MNNSKTPPGSKTSYATAFFDSIDPQPTFGRHLLSSGKVLELPICSHARPGAGLF